MYLVKNKQGSVKVIQHLTMYLHLNVYLICTLQRRKDCIVVSSIIGRLLIDTIDRTNLWRKLLANDINGRIFKVIHNLYKGAKACVRENGKFSNYFDSLIGVRQGDNLSPLLFAIYLNDLELFMSQQYPGLKLLKSEAEKCLEDEDVVVFFNLYV